MVTETQEILQELKEIKEELAYIKDNMPEREMFLTAEEKKLVDESYKHEKEGKLTSSKDLKRQLGI